ncbi:CheA signal transduction histidine kinase [Thalassoporum mexicanum PCC 7367]|uniref:hybrid sensor histidine kinase/response regulator n=1 Tax=Thalassoporum mexicanum TaxID=3457544 RepID=UPI00029FDE5E|nr:response regulator [Pseudanabaena sp. PCC 7367]AFY69545.1 CheA signal transduction histidine kinase [Pseudanabaena sp. PCC 7367]
MTHDEELEVRRLFLEEAQEYIDAIADGLVNLDRNLDDFRTKIDGVLRSAHSLKGASAMMQYDILSHCAHQLEDTFKLLKSHSPTIDENMERLLLISVDILSEIVLLYRQGKNCDQQWFDDHAAPILHELEAYVAVVTADSEVVEEEDDEADVVGLMFESEVEEYLTNLEQQLEQHQSNPELAESLKSTAEDLAALAEILELPKFNRLCEQVIDLANTIPVDRIPQLASTTLSTWRRSQALVLTGNTNAMPGELELPSSLKEALHNADNAAEVEADFDPEAQNIQDIQDIQDINDLDAAANFDAEQEADSVAVEESDGFDALDRSDKLDKLGDLADFAELEELLNQDNQEYQSGNLTSLTDIAAGSPNQDTDLPAIAVDNDINNKHDADQVDLSSDPGGEDEIATFDNYDPSDSATIELPEFGDASGDLTTADADNTNDHSDDIKDDLDNQIAIEPTVDPVPPTAAVTDFEVAPIEQIEQIEQIGQTNDNAYPSIDQGDRSQVNAAADQSEPEAPEPEQTSGISNISTSATNATALTETNPEPDLNLPEEESSNAIADQAIKASTDPIELPPHTDIPDTLADLVAEIPLQADPEPTNQNQSDQIAIESTPNRDQAAATTSSSPEPANLPANLLEQEPENRSNADRSSDLNPLAGLADWADSDRETIAARRTNQAAANANDLDFEPDYDRNNRPDQSPDQSQNIITADDLFAGFNTNPEADELEDLNQISPTELNQISPDDSDDALVFAIAPDYAIDTPVAAFAPNNRFDRAEIGYGADLRSPFELSDRPLYAEKIIRQTTGKYTLPAATTAANTSTNSQQLQARASTNAVGQTNGNITDPIDPNETDEIDEDDDTIILGREAALAIAGKQKDRYRRKPTNPFATSKQTTVFTANPLASVTPATPTTPPISTEPELPELTDESLLVADSNIPEPNVSDEALKDETEEDESDTLLLPRQPQSSQSSNASTASLDIDNEDSVTEADALWADLEQMGDESSDLAAATNRSAAPIDIADASELSLPQNYPQRSQEALADVDTNTDANDINDADDIKLSSVERQSVLEEESILDLFDQLNPETENEVESLDTIENLFGEPIDSNDAQTESNPEPENILPLESQVNSQVSTNPVDITASEAPAAIDTIDDLFGDAFANVGNEVNQAKQSKPNPNAPDSIAVTETDRTDRQDIPEPASQSWAEEDLFGNLEPNLASSATNITASEAIDALDIDALDNDLAIDSDGEQWQGIDAEDLDLSIDLDDSPLDWPESNNLLDLANPDESTDRAARSETGLIDVPTTTESDSATDDSDNLDDLTNNAIAAPDDDHDGDDLESADRPPEITAAASPSTSASTKPKHKRTDFFSAYVNESEEDSPTTASESPESSLVADTLLDLFEDLDASKDGENAAAILQSKLESKTELVSVYLKETSIRLPISRLEEMNDLSDQITVERNILESQLRRLRELYAVLSQRIQELDESDVSVHALYDKLSLINNRHESSNTPSVLLDLDRPAANFSLDQAEQLAQASEIGQANDSGADLEAESNDAENYTAEFDRLEMDRYGELHTLVASIIETIVKLEEVKEDINLSLAEAEQGASDLGRSFKQLQTKIIQARMRPLSDIVSRFPRMLRSLSLQHGKQVELEVEGGDLLIDRAILEALTDPLNHLVRNCFDHGIEDRRTRIHYNKPDTGKIFIRAVSENNTTTITIGDDGRGININKIREKVRQAAIAANMDGDQVDEIPQEKLLTVIFEPGFSTAEKVTSLSGRGVGMDVVRTNLKQIGAEIKADTKEGLGSTFTITFTNTLASVQTLLIEANNMFMAMPTAIIKEIVPYEPEQLVLTQPTLTQINEPNESNEAEGNEIAPTEDAQGQNTQTPETDRQQFKWSGHPEPIATIDLNNYLHFNRGLYDSHAQDKPFAKAPAMVICQIGQEMVAIAVDCCWGEQDASIRHVESDIPLPKCFSGCIISGSGQAVPLLNPQEILNWLQPEPIEVAAEAADERQIMPALEQEQGQVAQPQPQETTPTPATPKPSRTAVLVIDDSVNVRRYLALTLGRAGFHTEQAKDGEDALSKLRAGLKVDAIVSDIEMPRLDGYGLLANLRADRGYDQLPIVMLTSRSGDKHRQLAMNLGATEYFTKPYQEKTLVDTLKKLIAQDNQ